MADGNRLHCPCGQDDPSRRELNMNVGNRRKLLFGHVVRIDMRRRAPRRTARRPQDQVPPRRRVGRFKLAGQVRKNTNQMTPRIRIARPVETASSAATEGPGSPWRASVGVSTIWWSRLVVAMLPSMHGYRVRMPRPLAASSAGQRLMTADVPASRPGGRRREAAAVNVVARFHPAACYDSGDPDVILPCCPCCVWSSPWPRVPIGRVFCASRS